MISMAASTGTFAMQQVSRAQQDCPIARAPQDFLQSAWSVWARLHALDDDDMQQTSTMEICTFNTLEGCNRFFSTMRSPSRVNALELCVFKKDFFPLREACAGGGCWIVKLSMLNPDLLDELWDKLIEATVAGSFEVAVKPCILGAVFSQRLTYSRMELWISDCCCATIQIVGHAFHGLLQSFGFIGEIVFEDFQDTCPSLTFSISSVDMEECTPIIDTGQMSSKHRFHCDRECPASAVSDSLSELDRLWELYHEPKKQTSFRQVVPEINVENQSDSEEEQSDNEEGQPCAELSSFSVQSPTSQYFND